MMSQIKLTLTNMWWRLFWMNQSGGLNLRRNENQCHPTTEHILQKMWERILKGLQLEQYHLLGGIELSYMMIRADPYHEKNNKNLHFDSPVNRKNRSKTIRLRYQNLTLKPNRRNFPEKQPTVANAELKRLVLSRDKLQIQLRANYNFVDQLKSLPYFIKNQC